MTLALEGFKIRGMSSELSIPMPVRAYFEARNKFDVDAAIAQFEDDAIVEDEDEEYRSRDSIRAWIEQTQDKYRPAFDVRSAQQSQGNVVVDVSVSGTFPGSPLQIDHAFVVSSGKIARLTIG